MKGFFTVLIAQFFLLSLTLSAQQTDITPEERAQAIESYIQGITEFENEEFELALDHLTAAHLKLSDDPGINYALSDVYLVMGDLSNAAYYAQIAANADPENKWYHLQLASIYRQTGRSDASIQSLDNALKHHPNDLDILFMKANTFIEFGELLKSNAVFDDILKIRGSDFEIHLRKFQNFNALQMRDSALVQLEIMREINPRNLSTLHTISQQYMELGDEESARETLMDARERNPRDPQTLILLAEIYINNREWENLGETFISMIKDPLIYPSQKMELVRFIYMQFQQYPEETVLAEQTENIILEFSRNDPEYVPAQLVAADFFLQNNQLDLALENLERATEASPQEADAWVQRLQVLFSLQRFDEVIELSAQANEHVPNNAFIQFFTGTSYLVTSRASEAVQWLEEATLAPGRRSFRSVVYGTLGDAKQELGLWDEAVDAYEMALRLDSNNHNAMNNYAYFLSSETDDMEYAQELAEKAIALDPENAAYLDTVGWIYFKQGNYEKAQQYIQKSIDTGEASAEVYEHLGDVYNALNDSENAREWWRKALELDPDRDYLNERIQ